jgi:hypothetical protein
MLAERAIASKEAIEAARTTLRRKSTPCVSNNRSISREPDEPMGRWVLYSASSSLNSATLSKGVRACCRHAYLRSIERASPQASRVRLEDAEQRRKINVASPAPFSFCNEGAACSRNNLLSSPAITEIINQFLLNADWPPQVICQGQPAKRHSHQNCFHFGMGLSSCQLQTCSGFVPQVKWNIHVTTPDMYTR